MQPCLEAEFDSRSGIRLYVKGVRTVPILDCCRGMSSQPFQELATGQMPKPRNGASPQKGRKRGGENLDPDFLPPQQKQKVGSKVSLLITTSQVVVHYSTHTKTETIQKRQQHTEISRQVMNSVHADLNHQSELRILTLPVVKLFQEDKLNSLATVPLHPISDCIFGGAFC